MKEASPQEAAPVPVPEPSPAPESSPSQSRRPVEESDCDSRAEPDLFDTLDTDGDGSLSRAEFSQYDAEQQNERDAVPPCSQQTIPKGSHGSKSPIVFVLVVAAVMYGFTTISSQGSAQTFFPESPASLAAEHRLASLDALLPAVSSASVSKLKGRLRSIIRGVDSSRNEAVVLGFRSSLDTGLHREVLETVSSVLLGAEHERWLQLDAKTLIAASPDVGVALASAVETHERKVPAGGLSLVTLEGADSLEPQALYQMDRFFDDQYTGASSIVKTRTLFVLTVAFSEATTKQALHAAMKDKYKKDAFCGKIRMFLPMHVD